MARTFNEIFGESIQSVKELKAVIKEYQDSLIGVNADSEEFKETTEKLSVAQQELTKVTKAGKQEMNAAADSIVGMQKEYKELYDQYKLLSEEQRNSDFGRSMAESLNTLSTKLNESKKEVGNFKDNIGRYSDGVMEAFSKMGLSLGSFQAPFVALTKIVADGGKGIQDSIKGLTESVNGIGASLSSMGGPAKAASSALKSVCGAMKALIANPVGATIMAIVVAFKALSAIAGKVKKAINDNEESQMRLKEAMSAFQPIIDKVSNAFDRLGQRVVSFIEFLANTTRKFRELTAAITDFFGFTKGAKEQVKEQNEQYQRLAKTENELIKKRREYNELNAEADSEVQRLREEASETENVAEKKKFLTEAKEKQAEIDQRNIEIAQQELEQLQEEATLTANDEEMNNRLSEAKIKVSNATATAASNMRRFNREIKNAGKSAAGATKSLEDYREEAKKLYEQILDNNKTEIVKVTETYEEQKKLLMQFGYDTTLLTKQYTERIAKIRESDRATQVERTKVHIKQLSDFDAQYRQKLVEVYGETSREVADFDIGSIERRLIDIENLYKKYDKKFIDLTNKLSVEDNKLTEGSINAIKSFETELSEAIGQINERWTDLNLTPPPDFEFKDDDTIDTIVAKLKDYIVNFRLFADTLKVEGAKASSTIGLINADLRANKTAIEESVRDYKRFREDLEDLNTVATYDAFGLVNDQYAQKRTERSRKRAEEDIAFYKGLIDQENRILEESVREIEEQYATLIANAVDDKDRETMTALRNKTIEDLTKKSLEVRLGYEEEFYDAKARLRDMEVEAVQLAADRTAALWESAFDSFDKITGSINSVISTISSLTQAEMQNGNLSEKEYNKKKKQLENLAALQMAVSVASITASSASAIMDVWKAYASELEVNNRSTLAMGPTPAAAMYKAGLDAKSLASAILRTAGIGANAVAQIAAARGQYVSTVNNLQEGGGGGAAASVASVEEIESAPFTYSRTLQTQDEIDEMNRPIWVSVQDISDAQKQVSVRDQESRF